MLKNILVILCLFLLVVLAGILTAGCIDENKAVYIKGDKKSERCQR